MVRTSHQWVTNPSLSYDIHHLGFNHRLRKEEKYSCPLRSGIGADYTEGDEAGGRDQEEEGACILETQVWHSGWVVPPGKSEPFVIPRMAASREKLLTHRKKTQAISSSKTAVSLVEPISDSPANGAIREKIKVPSTKSRSALIPGEGKSMGMDID